MMLLRAERSSPICDRSKAKEEPTRRFDQALGLIEPGPKRRRHGPASSQNVTEEIARKRGDWWGIALLKAQIAELQNQPEQALIAYMEAVKKGNFQPTLIRRLVRLILEGNQPDNIERLARLLRYQDVALAELTALASAVDALRRGDATRALERLRQVISDGSTDFSDQLILGRFLAAAGQTSQADSHFKRAVELGPGLPAASLSYVQFLVSTKQAER